MMDTSYRIPLIGIMDDVRVNVSHRWPSTINCWPPSSPNRSMQCLFCRLMFISTRTIFLARRYFYFTRRSPISSRPPGS